MKKFFNLPNLHTYLVALVLLITLVITGAGFVKSAILYFLPANPPQISEIMPDGPYVFTDDAKEYYKDFARQNERKVNLHGLVVKGVQLLLFLPFFIAYWLRTRNIDEEANVPFTVKNLYFYLVSIITLFIILFSGSIALSNIIEYKDPVNPTMPLVDYVNMSVKEKAVPTPSVETEKITIDQSKLKELIKNQPDQNGSWRYLSLVDQITLIIIAIPVYILHWSRIRKLGLIT